MLEAYTVNITTQDLQIIFQALVEMPYKIAAGTIAVLQTQAAEQNAAAIAVKESSEKV